MESQGSKKSITEEEFRSCYPNVSIHHLNEKTSSRISSTPEKRQQMKLPQKTMQATPKTPVVKSPFKTQLVKTAQNNVDKTNSPVAKANSVNSGKNMVQSKLTVLSKPQLTPKSNVLIKTPAMASPQVVTKTVQVKTSSAPKSLFTPNKTPISSGQVVKSNPTPTKAATPVGNSANVLKTTAAKLPAVKTLTNAVKQPMMNVVKQQTPNVVKNSVSQPTPVVKEDCPDQSTMTVLTYQMPQTLPQRTSKQLTIEKIEPQQRIPVMLGSNNQVVLQQVIKGGQLVLQNRVTPVESSVQSVVIGTTAQPVSSVVTPLPQVEITTSEPLQALQVTQQVTLFRPKGNTFTVDDVKKQINLKKQNATNVVSSTTNSITASPAVPTQSNQPEQKKVVMPGRAQQAKIQMQPTKGSLLQRSRAKAGPGLAQQYSSTRGQTKQVSLKREIPMQKVSPMQPPPLPPSQILPPEQFGCEEEVTTSEDLQQKQGTQLILLLPSGEKKQITITDDTTLNCTIQELLKKVNVDLPDNMQETLSAEITSQSEIDNFQHTESSEHTQWEEAENVGPEPGEILGLEDELDPGNTKTEKDNQSQVDESQKEVEKGNTNPRFQEVLLAVCPFCAENTSNFSVCPRCKRNIPPDCKTIPFHSSQKSRKIKADSLSLESPKKKRICKRKFEEPVCLTISDDEELLGLAHHTHDSLHSDSSQMSSCDKEPVITDDMVFELKHSISGGGVDAEERLDNASPSEKTYLQCRTVRIGSYKVVPKDKVLITPYGMKFTVPVLNSDQYVELKIMYPEIIKVLMHFGRQMPVLFFYTSPAAAAKIRKALKMEDKKGCYYDTISSDETHRRITFLPDKIDEDCKSTLKNIFGSPEHSIFAELTGKEANDILVKASPKEVQAFILKKQPPSDSPQQQQPFDGQNIQTIMVYPPPPEKGGIPINTEDYACLGEDQFLNDVIIDFYLKYVVEKTLSPEDRARTHVFSSFFYKRLTTKPPPKRRSMNPVENDPGASPAVKRHSRVKSWTKNVNLFTKDFIVIPINESSHWFLAIVCFPGLTGPVRFSDNSPIDLPGRKKKDQVSGRSRLYGSTTITSFQQNSMLGLDGEIEDRDEADGEDEQMDIPDCEEEPVQKTILPDIKEEVEEEQIIIKKKQLQREPIKQPCILIFDSLAGASRSRVVATLRDYLRVEYEAKHGEAREFGGDVMKGSNVKCPQQTNYTDCGLYVLQYVEAFFQWPVTDYHIPIKQLIDWFQADIVSRKRYEIQQLLHRLMQEQCIDIESLNLPLLNLRPEGKSLVEYSGSEEDEDDDEEEEDEQFCDDEEEDMMDDDGEFHDDRDHDDMEHDDMDHDDMDHDDMDHENEDFEEGEIGHHDENDPANFLSPNMEHEDHEIDEDEYCIDEEEEELHEDDEDEMEEKELDELSLIHLGPVKGENLKNYRIPRLATKSTVNDSFKENQCN